MILSFHRALSILAFIVVFNITSASAQFVPPIVRSPYPTRIYPPIVRQPYPVQTYPIRPVQGFPVVVGPIRPPIVIPGTTPPFLAITGNPFTMNLQVAPGVNISPWNQYYGFIFSGIIPFGNGGGVQLTPGGVQNVVLQPLNPPNNAIQANNFGGGAIGMGGPAGANVPLVDHEKNALIAAQNNAKWAVGPNPETVKWANELQAAKPADPVLQFDVGLIYPSEEQLHSGEVLNDLVDRIFALEAKGKKAPSGLIPPELLDKVFWVGGAPADAMNTLRRANKPPYPALIRDDAKYINDLESVTLAHTQVVTTIQSGRSVLAKDMDRYNLSFKTLRSIVDLIRPSATVAEASELTTFLTTYENAIRFTTTKEAAGITLSKWNSVGVSISELVQHIHKNKVHFGRAADNDEAAYSSLHRGMLDYFAALAKAK